VNIYRKFMEWMSNINGAGTKHKVREDGRERRREGKQRDREYGGRRKEKQGREGGMEEAAREKRE
jgi:hypothetical protein